MHDLVDFVAASLARVDSDTHRRLDIGAPRDDALDADESADVVGLDLAELDVLDLRLARSDDDRVLPFELGRESILDESALDGAVANEATLDGRLASLLLVEATLLHH